MDKVSKTSTIKLSGLAIGYHNQSKERVIFGPFSVGISNAELVGIIGRNGIGKSTLLRTIAGLQRPLTGKVLINDESTEDLSIRQMARLISFVSTEAVQAFQIKVNEIVAIGRFPYTGWFGKLDQDDKVAIQRAITQTGIEHLLDKSLHEISDGEKQKVMIARALAQDTPVIILDEPTAFLDLPSRFEILNILHELTLSQNKTILFSTHDLSIAMDVADKLWLLTDDGIFQGAPEDLIIDKVFRKLFINSPVEFDTRSSTFRFKRRLNGLIGIVGEKKHRLLTKRALERIGFQTSEDLTDITVHISEIDGKPLWYLQNAGKNIEFDSLYAMMSYFKSRDD